MPSGGTTAYGFLLVLAIFLPLAGAILSVASGSRYSDRIAGAMMPFGLATAVAIAGCVWWSRAPLQYALGDWQPPLGVALRADGLSTVMMLAVGFLIPSIAIFAQAPFAGRSGTKARAPTVFWTLLLVVWGALNAVFLGADLFNLFVAFELLTFAAVPLVCLDGRHETLAAALRYLLFALVGSVFYLLGTVLLYGAYGTLDIGLLANRIRPEPAAWAALAVMTAGLLAKTALYPFHLWLPPAHAGAPAPASAILSGLVVKAPFFVVVRLWFDLAPVLIGWWAAQLLGTLAAAAILFGSIVALRQVRLKLLIAYSTVAQIGYLFLMFPLAAGAASGRPWAATAWTAGMLQALSHAFAKAAMFMAAGLIYEALGHDRVSDLGGIGRVLPVTVFAFALGGMSLMGLPPSGGFVAKAMLLTAAVAAGQWWWAVVVLLGGLLAAGYVFLVLARMLADAPEPVLPLARISPTRQGVVLAMALVAVALGFAPLRPWAILAIGHPAAVLLGFK